MQIAAAAPMATRIMIIIAALTLPLLGTLFIDTVGSVERHVAVEPDVQPPRVRGAEFNAVGMNGIRQNLG